MKTKELNVSNVVSELVKNSIDAQSSVIQIEFNQTFDVRVIDDGCGFTEEILQDIGKRQLFISNVLQRDTFRYGNKGKSLFSIAQITAEIYIESIKRNSDVRLYKNINAQKSEYKIYKTDRGYKDAMVTTSQGSMVVLNKFSLSIDDANTLKTNIIKSVIELALINFEVNISVKDTATHEILYESFRTKNLFDKFEQFLQSNNFFSKIQFLSCQKHNVKVDLFLCDDGIARKSFQFVYFNKLNEHDGKWTKIINKLCNKKFENDLNSKYPVYLVNICAVNYLDNQLATNVIIENCIKKCVEQASQPQSKGNVARNNSQDIDCNNEIQMRSEVPPVNATNKKVDEKHGVRLGDWIFNNSCENYEILNQGREMYRKKICENWVTSLSKPKPKDVNDSLASVEINKTQQGEHLFKTPAPPATQRKIQKNGHSIGKTSKIKSSAHVSTQIYKPSQNVKTFNNSSLMRASRKLVSSRGKPTRKTKNVPAKKNRINNVSLQIPKRKSILQTKDVDALPIEIVSPIQDDRFENLDEAIRNITDTFKPPMPIPDRVNKSNDHVIYRSTKKTLDFKLHKSERATNFNLNFSSSIAIQTMNDPPFMGFFENDGGEITSISNLFENNVTAANHLPLSTPQPQLNRHCGSSYSQTSQLHYRQNHNNSIRTHYRQQTYCNFNRDHSLTNSDRYETNSRVDRHRRPKSVRSSSNSQTTIVPTTRSAQSSSIGVLNDHVRQSGWPVTININFGQSK